MLRTLVWETVPADAGKTDDAGKLSDGAAQDGGAPGWASPAGVRVASHLPPVTAEAARKAGTAGKAGKDADVLPPFCRELDDPTQISDLLERPDHYLWLDLTAPSAEELRLIAEEFSLHPLAVEDAAEHSQRPKIEQYDGFYLMVVFAITTDTGPAADDIAGT